MALSTSVSKIVARRYAKALIDLAIEKKKLPKIEKDLDSLNEMLSSSEDFVMMVESSAIKSTQKIDAIAALGKKAKFQDETVNFLKILAGNGRLPGLGMVLSVTQEMLAENRNEMTAEICSASALTAAQSKKLQASLSDATGKNVVLEAKTDDALMGGMQITLGSVRVDASLAGRLDRLKVELSKRVTSEDNDNQNIENLNKKEA